MRARYGAVQGVEDEIGSFYDALQGAAARARES
jgi:hypothetical protein